MAIHCRAAFMKEGRKTALPGRSPLEGGIVIENRAVLPAAEDR